MAIDKVTTPAVTESAPKAVASTSPAVKCSVPITSSAILASVTASAFIFAVVTALSGSDLVFSVIIDIVTP